MAIYKILRVENCPYCCQTICIDISESQKLGLNSSGERPGCHSPNNEIGYTELIVTRGKNYLPKGGTEPVASFNLTCPQCDCHPFTPQS